jgi:hypothetical protein
MKTYAYLATLFLLSACGAETVGSAAVTTKARQNEVEAAKQSADQIQAGIEQAQRLNDEKLRAAEGNRP